MKQQILHTPEGVRDIYSIEYRKKQVLETKLQKIFHLYGYQDVQTPMFEYFDVFGKEIGTIPSKELYKFFDREGNTLVLRPDITPSIARVATTIFESELLPVRLCYQGNTFINHSSYKGRLHENTQAGAELIGIDSVEADAEMVVMAIDSLKEVGLKEFQIHIGCVAFFENLISQAKLNADGECRLRELIQNRNYFGVDELLEKDIQPQLWDTEVAFQEEILVPELIRLGRYDEAWSFVPYGQSDIGGADEYFEFMSDVILYLCRNNRKQDARRFVNEYVIWFSSHVDTYKTKKDEWIQEYYREYNSVTAKSKLLKFINNY